MSLKKLQYVFPIFGQNLNFLKTRKDGQDKLIFGESYSDCSDPVALALSTLGLNVSPDDCVQFRVRVYGDDSAVWLVWAGPKSKVNVALPQALQACAGEVYMRGSAFGLDEQAREVFSQLYPSLLKTVAYGELRSSLTGKPIAS